MKMRYGFVTNSSSSNFLIVGVTDRDLIELLARCEGKERIECDHGIDSGEFVSFYGNYDRAYYAGIPIESLLEASMRLSNIKLLFQQNIEIQYGIHIPLESIKLYYGEVGE